MLKGFIYNLGHKIDKLI